MLTIVPGISATEHRALGDRKCHRNLIWSSEKLAHLEPDAGKTVQRDMTLDLVPTPLDTITVLLVEDDELQRMTLSDTLEDQGLDVLQAASAIDAIKVLETHPEVRLVFTDIQLEGHIDGLDLWHVVHMRGPHISLLTTSGRVRPHYAELPETARFIQKPLQEREMLKQMDELLAGMSYPSVW